jgi:hypothetical protein
MRNERPEPARRSMHEKRVTTKKAHDCRVTMRHQSEKVQLQGDSDTAWQVASNALSRVTKTRCTRTRIPNSSHAGMIWNIGDSRNNCTLEATQMRRTEYGLMIPETSVWRSSRTRLLAWLASKQSEVDPSNWQNLQTSTGLDTTNRPMRAENVWAHHFSTLSSHCHTLVMKKAVMKKA